MPTTHWRRVTDAWTQHVIAKVIIDSTYAGYLRQCSASGNVWARPSDVARWCRRFAASPRRPGRHSPWTGPRGFPAVWQPCSPAPSRWRTSSCRCRPSWAVCCRGSRRWGSAAGRCRSAGPRTRRWWCVRSLRRPRSRPRQRPFGHRWACRSTTGTRPWSAPTRTTPSLRASAACAAARPAGPSCRAAPCAAPGTCAWCALAVCPAACRPAPAAGQQSRRSTKACVLRPVPRETISRPEQVPTRRVVV